MHYCPALRNSAPAARLWQQRRGGYVAPCVGLFQGKSTNGILLSELDAASYPAAFNPSPSDSIRRRVTVYSDTAPANPEAELETAGHRGCRRPPTGSSPGGAVVRPAWSALQLGQLPRVLAAHRAEQTTDVVPHPTPRLDTREAVPDLQEELFRFLVPLAGGYVVNHTEWLQPDVTTRAAATRSRDGPCEPAPLPAPPRYTPPTQAVDQAKHQSPAGVLGGGKGGISEPRQLTQTLHATTPVTRGTVRTSRR